MPAKFTQITIREDNEPDPCFLELFLDDYGKVTLTIYAHNDSEKVTIELKALQAALLLLTGEG